MLLATTSEMLEVSCLIAVVLMKEIHNLCQLECSEN